MVITPHILLLSNMNTVITNQGVLSEEVVGALSTVFNDHNIIVVYNSSSMIGYFQENNNSVINPKSSIEGK